MGVRTPVLIATSAYECNGCFPGRLKCMGSTRETGRLRLLATRGKQRPPGLSRAPTLREAGFDIVINAPNGIGVPAGIAPDVAATLGSAMERAVMSSAFKQACAQFHASVMYQRVDDYRRYVFSQYERQKQLIERLNLREQLKHA